MFAAPVRRQLERNRVVEARLQSRARPESDAITPRGRLLQRLYQLHKSSGGSANADSNEMANLFSIDPDLVDGAAVELHNRNLVRFDVCDHGLINVRLTALGIQQIENPASAADWHAHPLDTELGPVRHRRE